MSEKLKHFIINAAKVGLNGPEMCLYLCSNKDKITHKEYLQFTKWLKKNELFYYWLRKRVNPEYAK